MKIDFPKKAYEKLKKHPEEGDVIGEITEGAVSCQFTVFEDDFSDCDFKIDDKHALNAYYFVLGKDTGYGDINGIPYDIPDGFYAEVKDTYEEFISYLKKVFYEYMPTDVIKACDETELTWENVRKGENVC